MSLRKYLTSRVFFAQSLAALAILAVLSYLFMHWLTFTTDHGHEITVPNLAKLTEEQVEEKLDELDLDYVLLDSVDYNSDFVSGIILLADSSLKVNDVIDVNGLVCRVQEINLRTTTVLTRDDKYIILPNSDLTRNQIINWTHSDIASRFEINVGVDYSTDVSLVMKVLREVIEIQEGVLKEPTPFIRFTDYGESSLNFSLFFWSEEVFRVENIKSELRVKIFESFKRNGIKIPFPQRVIHNEK